MRVLKFRFVVGSNISPTFTIAQIMKAGIETGKYPDEANPHMKTIQYVGIKDIHGKEVFEGDICKRAMVGDLPYAVEWSDTGFFWSDGDMVTLDDEVEIIGNIFQNPELL